MQQHLNNVYMDAFGRHFNAEKFALHSRCILSVYAFFGNQTYDIGVARVVIHFLSYCNAILNLKNRYTVRMFISRLICVPVAQTVEYSACNAKVVGSVPRECMN